MKPKKFYIYIMTNKSRRVLYIGVTGNLEQRIFQHKKHVFKGSFTDKYNCEYCIYYEEFRYVNDAIARETELKKWNRKKKEKLISALNPTWRELVNENGYIRNK
ncbi:MAG: GIY-YIG nuclease family protein [Bacteroidales bacterium]|nr:GIY-YIG nuclease family protein [Bacteroidales bacterium]